MLTKHLAMVALNGAVYALGGVGEILSTKFFYSYSKAVNSFHCNVNLISFNHNQSRGFLINGLSTQVQTEFGKLSSVATVERYDPADNHWSEVRSGHRYKNYGRTL